MAMVPLKKGLWAACLLALGGASSASAQSPTPSDLLKYQPKQKDVTLSTPAANDIAVCSVEKLPNGYLLVDARKQPLRKLFSTNGRSINVYSYFRDGVEVYRETASAEKIDQFRWLGSAGSKMGVDNDGDGTIDSWRIISPEEVGYEAFQALKTGNFARMQALLIDAKELAALRLPADETQAITARLQKAPKTFSDVAAAKKLSASEYLQFSSSTPNEAAGASLYLADMLGSAADVAKLHQRSIVVKNAVGNEFLQMADMILVGQAWRLTGIPGDDVAPAQVAVGGNETGGMPQEKDPFVLDKLKELGKVDAAHAGVKQTEPPYAGYMAQRVAIIQEILPKSVNREMWYKQICDNLSGAYLAQDNTALVKLEEMHKQFAQANIANLAAYTKYRLIVAKYTRDVAGPTGPKAQETYQADLADFVKTYAKSEDAPYALYQLALSSEFTGKDEEGKRWYRQLYTNFPTHLHAEDAKGSERRLDLMGKQIELAGTELGTSQSFDIKSRQGKIVIVYYWASYANICVGDFARMKKLLSEHGSDVALVTVSLDDSPAEASKFLQSVDVTGTHLYQPAPAGQGGMKSPLAVTYGINGIPQMFVVGRDGRVVNNRAQVGDLENEIKKAK